LVKNKRRMEVATGNPGISTNFVDMDFDKGQAFNVHGFRLECVVEPEVGDANANGLWAVWVLPGGVVQNSDLPAAFGEFGDEKFSPYLWGIGAWAAANQTTSKIEFAPKSSRNLQAGARIVFELLINGVSSGGVRFNAVLTCFTSPI